MGWRKRLFAFINFRFYRSKPTGSEAKKGLQIDPRRVLLLFAVVASFAIVMVLYLLVMDSGEPLTVQEDQF